MRAVSLLFLPDRYMDARLWGDIPDSLSDQVRVVFYDQSELPWHAADGEFTETIRRLTGGSGFQVVVSAGGAARFAVALAEAGLAEGIVFFQAALDSMPDDIHLDFSDIDLEHAPDPYQPLADALEEPDPGQWRSILLVVFREILAGTLDQASLQLALSMYGDHAEEIRADLRAARAAAPELEAGETVTADQIPDPPSWPATPWIDRLQGLPVPVAAVAGAEARTISEAIVRRTGRGEVVVAEGTAGLATSEDRRQGAEALRRMLDRVAGG